tara:strand:+ start:821 stop:1165 length:345 start_codon:yes stop_codon:yes gene_type:complete
MFPILLLAALRRAASNSTGSLYNFRFFLHKGGYRSVLLATYPRKNSHSSRLDMKAAFLNLAVQLGRFLGISIESEEAPISCFLRTDGKSFPAASKILKFLSNSVQELPYSIVSP